MNKIELRWPNYLRVSMVLLGIISVLLVTLRVYYNISFDTPLQLITSGDEEEALFSIWKYVNGEVVYQDPQSIPFAASYFNWLFYIFYGSIIKLSLTVFGLSSEWIPTIGRLITLTISVLGVIPVYLLFKRFFVLKENRDKLIVLSATAFIVIGPLVGFWSITTRPDVLAMILELCGLLFLLSYIDNRSKKSLYLFILFCYLAWATKHTFITVVTGGCLYFIFDKRYLELVQTVCISFLLYALTFLLSTPEHLHMVFFAHETTSFWAKIWVVNFKLFIGKLLPFLLMMFISWLYLARLKKIGSVFKEYYLLQPLVFCFIIGLAISLGLSPQGGASDNYYFPVLFLIVFFGIFGVSALLEQNYPSEALNTKYLKVGFSASLYVEIILIILIIFGVIGSLTPRSNNDMYQAYKECIAELPKPVFTKEGYASLPWINPSEHHFVLASLYRLDRKAGFEFEKGGIEGLIKEGYFSSILVDGQPFPVINEELYPNYQLMNKVPSVCSGKTILAKKTLLD